MALHYNLTLGSLGGYRHYSLDYSFLPVNEEGGLMTPEDQIIKL